MHSIAAQEFLSWEKKQLFKGGDKESLYLLLESLAGISHNELNLLRVNPERDFYLKKN